MERYTQTEISDVRNSVRKGKYAEPNTHAWFPLPFFQCPTHVTVPRYTILIIILRPDKEELTGKQR